MQAPIAVFWKNQVRVSVYEEKIDLGRAAAARAASAMIEAIERRGQARIIVGTGPSQNEVISALAADSAIDWSKVEVFHMDEYAGLPADHPASFGRWLREHLADKVHPAGTHCIRGDTPDVTAECERYARLLDRAPIDVVFVGFGENGHIAFNDPHAADFADPLTVKRVLLDDRCRLQQVGEGHFPNLESVPPEAISITCTAILRARHLICSVPDRRKAEAVRNAIEGPLTTACPASLVFTHPNAEVFLDRHSASLLEGIHA